MLDLMSNVSGPVEEVVERVGPAAPVLATLLVGTAILSFSRSNHHLKVVLELLLGVLFYLVSAVLLLPFVVYRQLVRVLYLVWGPRYTLMNGEDALWNMDTQSCPVINIACFLKLDPHEDGVEVVRRLLKERLYCDPQFGDKVCSRQRVGALGYYYWEKGHEPVVEALPPGDLHHALGAMAGLPLPDRAAVHVLVGEGEPRPVLFRVHHGVGDGYSLLAMLRSSLAEPTDAAPLPPPRPTTTLPPPSLLHTIYTYLVGPASFLSLVTTPTTNCVHGVRLSGRKLVAWRIEEGLLERVRRRARASASTVSAVVLTAASTALAAHCRRHHQPVPDHFNAVLPLPGPAKSSPQNNLTVTVVRVPREGCGQEEVRHAVQDSGLPQVYRLVMGVLIHLVPAPLARTFLIDPHATFVLSNLPGPTASVSLHHLPLQDIVFWLPQLFLTGVGLTMLSYEGRLSMGLMVDTSLMQHQTDVELLIDDLMAALRQAPLPSSQDPGCSHHTSRLP